MGLEKTLLILGMLISGFVFSVSFATLYAQTHILEGTVCSCTLPIPLLIPMFASFGLLIGLITFYLLSPWFVKRQSKSLKLALELLDPDEMLVVNELLENGGQVLQAKLSREMGKVKCFRVLERLRERGVIEKEKERKTNIVKLSEKFLDLAKA